MKLDRDGHLTLLESDVERHRREYLLLHGWRILETRAEGRMPSGRPMHGKGTQDWIAIKSHYNSAGRARCPAEGCSIIIIENKRRMARTEAKRKLSQAANQSEWERAGYCTYRDEDGTKDPIGDFKRWFEERFS